MSEKGWKTLIFVYLSACFIGGCLSLLWLWNGGMATGWSGADWSSARPFFYYIAAGSVGGTLYALRAFHQFYEQPLEERFIFWYIMRPYMCGGTAMMTIVLLDSGILLLQADDSMAARTGLSFLAGFGYGKFMEKLTHLVETLFNGKNQEHEQSDDSR